MMKNKLIITAIISMVVIGGMSVYADSVSLRATHGHGRGYHTGSTSRYGIHTEGTATADGSNQPLLQVTSTYTHPYSVYTYASKGSVTATITATNYTSMIGHGHFIRTISDVSPFSTGLNK